MCTGDSATCSATAATWTMVNSSSPDQTWSQSLTSSLKASFRVVRADTANSNNLVYSRAVHRAWGVEYGPRTDWVYPFTAKAVDTAAMRSLYGASTLHGEGVTSLSLSVDDSGLLFQATWDSTTDLPFTGFVLPIDTGAHGWDWRTLASVTLQKNAAQRGSVSMAVSPISPVLDERDISRGRIPGWSPTLSVVQNTLGVDVGHLVYAKWMLDSATGGGVFRTVTIAELLPNVTSLKFSFGPMQKSAGRYLRFRLYKLSFTGTMRPKE